MFRVADEAGRRMPAKAGHRKRRNTLCSGYTPPIYYTLPKDNNTNTLLGAAFGVAWLFTQSFVCSPASAELIFHGTLFHESGQDSSIF